MKTISRDELNERIMLHQKWLKKTGGEILVLADYDLSGSDLSGSNLRGSDLSCSDLSCSELSYAIGNMREIKSMQLDKWMITYTQTDMAIGCQQHPIKDWFAFDDEKIASMDSGALDWWRKWKPVIQQILNVEGD